MKYKIDLQDTVNDNTPNRFHIQRWVNETLCQHVEQGNLCIRIVNRDEIRELNAKYRKQDKPTNVLSFPADLPFEIQQDLHMLGDIIICSEVIQAEAEEQGKPCEAHWAHMIVHGTLHLLGYDHITDEDAKNMESLEINILNKLGFNNPYERRQ